MRAFVISGPNEASVEIVDDPQPEPGLRDVGEMRAERVEGDAELAARIAVIRIDRHHLQRPGAAIGRHGDMIAGPEIQPARQLLADQRRIAAGLIVSSTGRTLLVRKRGTTAFMQPGGKIEPWGNSPAEMDWVNSWAQMADFELILQGMTKAGVGMEAAGSYAEFFAFMSLVHPDAATREDCARRARTLLMHVMNEAVKGQAPDSAGARGNFKGLNENYARELMELHTLGVDGGYTQEDVVTLARILTGWGFRRPNPNQNQNPRARLVAQNLHVDLEVAPASLAPFHPGRCAELYVGERIVGTALLNLRAAESRRTIAPGMRHLRSHERRAQHADADAMRRKLRPQRFRQHGADLRLAVCRELIDQPVDGARRRRRVQRAEDEVPRLRRLDRDRKRVV